MAVIRVGKHVTCGKPLGLNIGQTGELAAGVRAARVIDAVVDSATDNTWRQVS